MTFIKRLKKLVGDLLPSSMSRAVKPSWERFAGDSGFRSTLQEAIDSDDGDGVDEGLVWCWEKVSGEVLEKSLGLIFERSRDPVDTRRLVFNARALLATAGVVRAVRDLQRGWEGPLVARLSGWARRAYECLEGRPDRAAPAPAERSEEEKQRLASLGHTLAVTDTGDVARLGAILDVLPPAPMMRFWCLHWLNAQPACQRTLRVPVAAVKSETEGLIIGVRWALLGEGTGALVEHPDSALVPLGGELLDCLADAWGEAQPRVWWSLGKYKGPFSPTQALGGPSLGAAVTVGLRLLCEGRPYDADWIVLAAVAPDRRQLQPVRGVPQKLDGAEAAKLRGAVLCARDDDLRETQRRDWLEKLHLEERSTVADVCDLVSGRAMQLDDYLRLLAAAPERTEGQPAYLNGKSPAQLYVEPDVLKFEPVKQSVGPDEVEEGHDGSRPEPEPRDPVEVQDVGEATRRAGRERQVEHRLPWAEVVRTLACGSKRCVVVEGPPGQGKTELATMTARSLAEQARREIADQVRGVGGVGLALVLSLEALERQPPDAVGTPEQQLRQAIRQTLVDGHAPMAIAEYLAEHAHEERCWLFLDGLDQVANRTRLNQFLQVLKGWQSRVVIGTRPCGYEPGSLPLAVAEYRLAPFSPGQAQAFVTSWGGGARQRLEALLGRPSVGNLAQSPFLLTLLCWVGGRRADLPEDLTRTQLYDRVLRDLLGQRPEALESIDEERAALWLPALEEIALALLCDNVQQALIPSERLHALLRDSKDRPPTLTDDPHASLPERVTRLLQELGSKRFLVPARADRSTYEVPHRSFLEFLAGCRLARLSEEGQGEVAKGFVDRKAWDPDWEQAVLFCCGRLQDPGWLLDRLADERTDDYFRHRLALAGQCLGEIRAAIRSWVGEQINAVTQACAGFWWRAANPNELSMAAAFHGIPATHIWISGGVFTVEAFPHLSKSLPGLARANGLYDGKPLLVWLEATLRSPETRSKALDFVRESGAAAATGTILNALVQAINDDGDEFVRVSAEKVLGELGAAAATPVVLDALARALHDGNYEVQQSAAKVLTRIGLAARTAQVVTALLGVLRSGNRLLTRLAIEALLALGVREAGPEILTPLREALHQDNLDMKRFAAKALEVLGLEAAAPDVLTTLVQRLHDSEQSMRSNAARTLAALGAPAATREVLSSLVQLLRHRDPDLQLTAAKAVEALGPAGVTPDVLAALIDAISDGEQSVKFAAVKAVGNLGAAAATPAILSALIQALDDDDPDLQWSIGHALTALGEAAATPEALTGLLHVLRDGNPFLRRVALEVLPALGPAAAVPEVLTALILAMRDGNSFLQRVAAAGLTSLGKAAAPEVLSILRQMLGVPSVRCRAAKTLSRLGAVAATPEILATLLQMVHDTQSSVRADAAEVLEGLGEPAATSEVLTALVGAVRDCQPFARSALARALGRLTTQRFRFFPDTGTSPTPQPGVRLIRRTVEELSSAHRPASP